MDKKGNMANMQHLFAEQPACTVQLHELGTLVIPRNAGSMPYTNRQDTLYP